MSNPMNLTIPVVGVTTGPTYAQNVSDALEKIAPHTHTGDPDGNQIPAAGLAIDGDVSFNVDHSLTDLKSLKMASQSATLGGVGDVNVLYFVNGDAYANNGSGTPVKITSGSAVNTAGSNLTLTYLAVASNHTIVSSDLDTFFGIDTSAPRTITLPSAASVAAGRRYWLADVTGNAFVSPVTINKSGLDTIDGATSHKIQENYAGCVIVSNGTNGWAVLDCFNGAQGITIDGALNFTGQAFIGANGGSRMISEDTSFNINIGDGGDTNSIGLHSAGDVTVDAPSAVLTLTSNETDFNIGGAAFLGFTSSAGAALVQFDGALTGVTIKQPDKTGNGGTAASLTIQAQNETGTSSFGGALKLKSGSGTDATLGNGTIDIVCGSQAIGKFSGHFGEARFDADSSAIDFVLTANATNQQLVFYAIGTGGKVVIAANTSISFGDAGGAAITVTPAHTGTTTFAFATGVTAANINQADKTANSGTGATLTVQAQNETGTTSTGGALVLASGTGTSTHGSVTLKAGSVTFLSSTSALTTAALPVAFGTNPAATGALRLASAASINWRNAANSGDLLGLRSDSSNNLVIGDATNTPATIVNGATTVEAWVAAAPILVASSTKVALSIPTVEFATAQVNPKISQADKTTNSGTGNSLTLQAQNETGTTSTGGALVLQSGSGTTTDGNITLKNGTTTFATLFNGTVGTGAVGAKHYIDFGGVGGGLASASHILSIAYGAGTDAYYLTESGHVRLGDNSNLSILTVATADGVILNHNVLTFGTIYTPIISQADLTTNSATGAQLTIHAQNETGTTSTGGALLLKSGTGTTANGNVTIQALNSGALQLDTAVLKFRDAGSADTLSWTLSSTGTVNMTAATGVTSYNIKQSDKTTNSGTGATLTIQAQNETGTTSNGGPLVLQSGTGTTADGAVTIKTGTTTRFTASAVGIGFYAHAPVALQTGVAVTAAGIHAACVALGLFTA